MKCEHCSKKQETLNACTLFGLWLCDYCYSITLNPYTRDESNIERWIEETQFKIDIKEAKK